MDPTRHDARAQQIDRFWPTPGSSADVYVPSSAGAIHVRRAGAGRPVVLLHSNGHSWHEFSDVIPILGEDLAVYAWDMPGHGASDAVHARTSIRGYADVLAQVLDELGVRGAVVAGCSVGAFVAAELAARPSDRVSGVVLSEFAFRDSDWWREHWTDVCDLFAVATQSVEEVNRRLVREVSLDVVEQWNRDRNLAGPRQMLGVMWAIRQHDMAGALAKLTVPTAVLCGAAGPTAECMPDVQAVLYADARMELVEHAGHFISVDRPDVFAKVVREIVLATRPVPSLRRPSK